MRKRVLAGLIEALYGSVVRWVWWQRAAVRCGNRAQRRHAARERARKLRRWYARTPIRLPGRIEFEALEPRVVLSGDLNPVGAAIVAQDVAAQHFTLPAENAGPAIILGPVVEGQPLTVADGDGTEVTFTLNGAGTGEVSATAEGFDVSVTGSTTASALAVTTTGGDGRANLHNLNVTESLQSFSGATLDLTGDILVSGTLATLNLGNIGAAHQATILGTGVALQFIAGNVVDLSMNVASPIASLNVQSWQDLDGVRDVIRAPSIGTLVSAGNFNASLDLTGAATGFTLTSATIGGMVNGGQWSITGRVNQVVAQSTGADWRLNASSAISLINVAQTLSGQISAPSMQLIQVGGDLNHATIWAGANLGTDVALGGTGLAADVFTKGTLARLRVTGKVIESQIYVGVDPKNGVFNDGDDQIVPGSGIQELIVGQTIDGASKVIAGVLPATVRVNGATVPATTLPSIENQPQDTVAPVVSAALTNDTGAGPDDGLTRDPAVNGTVAELGTIAQLRARLDATPAFTDVTGKLQPDKSFVLDGATLNALAGGTLQQGPHVLHLQAVDGGGNVGSVDLAFTLDTQGPAAPAFDLAAGSDTAPTGDQQTTAASVTLEGTTEALAVVRLLATGAQTTADGSGAFHFDGVALALGANAFTVRATDSAGNSTEAARTITRLGVDGGEEPGRFILSSHTPLEGADGVGIGVRPAIVFSKAVDLATLTDATFFATAAGEALPANIVVDPSGLFARLFFSAPMPGGTAVEVTVNGSAILAAADGTLLDADGDGAPGGLLTFSFATVSTTPLPGTTLSGRLADAGPDLVPFTADDTLPGPDGQLGTPDDVILTPIADARIFVRGLEDDFVLTGADGTFHLDAVPGGTVALALVAESAAAPPGFTYPEMTSELEMAVGIDNQIGTFYMPRLATAAIQTVDTRATTILTLPPAGALGLTEEQRQQFTLEIPPGGLLGPDGRPVGSAQVLMSIVPTNTRPLPPTLPEPVLGFTVQLLGATDAGGPIRMTLPNLSDAPAGTEFLVVSFDPITGQFVDNGVAKVGAVASPSVLAAAGNGAISDEGGAGASPSMLAAAGDGPGIAQVGAQIVWTPLLANMCFHFLLSGVSATGPPCPPVPAHDIEVKPEPDFSGLDSRLFTRDDGSFQLFFANQARPLSGPDPCFPSVNSRATPLVVDIEVDGPFEAFLQGLQPHRFELLPGQSQDIIVDLLDFAPVLKTLTADQLFAVNVHVTGFASNAPGELLIDETFAIVRYVPVVDPAGERAEFLKTLADGSGGFTRGKRVDYHLPVEVDTTITSTDDPNFILNRDGPLFGEGATTWLYDPVSAANRFGRATITVGEDELPQRLPMHGTAVRPTIISPDRNEFEILLAAFLDDARHFTVTPGTLLASQTFIDEFKDGIPFFHGGTLTQDQLDKRKDTILAAGNELVNAVSADFAPVNGSFSGYTVLHNGGDVAVEWRPVISDGSAGLGDRDRDRDRLQAALPDPDLPDVAKEWVFAESLNPQPVNAIELNFDIHAARWNNNKTPFPTFIANTVSHELGHTFGLNDAYLDTPSMPEPLAPFDIMSSAHRNMTDRAFADVNVDTLRAAIGLAPDAPGALQSAIQMYRRNFNLPNNTVGILPIGPDGDTTPVLGVRAGDDDLFTGDLLAAGTVLADGAGGAAATRAVTLTNVGRGPLTIGALAFADGAAGFSLAGPSPTGTVLDIGESVTVDLVFDPASAGAFTDTLSITSDAPGEPYALALAGDGLTTGGRIAASLARDPATGDPVQNNLGGLALGAGPRTAGDLLTLRNTGGGPLTITAVSVAGEAAAQFAIGGLPAGFGPGNPLVLAPGETFSLDVTFDATALGLQRARIEIASDDPETPVLRQTVVGTGLADTGSALDYGHDFVAVEQPGHLDEPVVRTVSDAGGNWTFYLPAGQSFHHAIFDPASGLIAHGFGVTELGATETDVLTPVFVASRAPDRDGDGLPDDVEFAIGSEPGETDTDDDGLDDFAEIAAGLDPLDGVAAPSGVIGALALAGEAWDVAVDGRTAYVATGHHGLAVIDISEPDRPILLGATNLPGLDSAVAVDVDGRRSLAAVVTDDGVDTGSLHVVDVSDAAHPVRLRTVALPDRASHVDVLDGVAFVASGTALLSVELTTGDVLQTLDFGGGFLTGLAREGRTLFTMDVARTLRAVDISGDSMVAGDSLDVGAGGGGEIFVGGGIAYVTQGTFPSAFDGFATIDVSDPGDLILISRPDNLESRPDRAVAADGSGRALVIGSVPNPSDPFSQPLNIVDAADVSDPADTDAYVTRFLLPEFPLGITLASGVALVADGDGGLMVLRYRSDSAGQPPAVSVRTLADDADPVAPGLQVLEGSLLHVLIDATDDVLVRGVEVLVNGQPVGSDTSFPYEALLTASASAGPMTVQARATDTGGNVGLSNTLVVQVGSDTVAPTIVAIDPADGATVPEGLQQVTVRFSEALDPGSVSASTFRVVSAGQTVAPLGVDLLSESRLVQLRFAGLAAGDYQLVIDADAVTDLAGNALGAVDVVSDFTLTGEAVTWINPAGGFWDDTANWEGGQLPGPNDNVLIDVPANVTITHRQGTTVINRLISREAFALTGGTLDVNTTIQVDNSFTIGNGATLARARVLPGAGGQGVTVAGFGTFDAVTLTADVTVPDTAELSVENGLTLDGARLTLASTGSFAALSIFGDQILGGTGEVFFGGTADNNSILQSSGTLTIGPGIIIRGSQGGTVGGFGDSSLVLEGTVLAETAGETIRVDAAWINAGLVKAENGGTVELRGNVTFADAGTFDARGGTVKLVGTLDNAGKTLGLDATTGSLTANGGRIVGGILTFADGATLAIEVSVTLEGVTLASDLTIASDLTTGIRTVFIEGGLTLDGANVTLFDGGNPFVGPRLTFRGTQTLGGTGQVVFAGAEDDSVLSLLNSGTTLTIAPGITITGTAPGAEIGSTSGTVINQGVISFAFGTINANVINAGRIAPVGVPGEQTGTINIVGNFTQTASGVLAIQLGGTATTAYDRLLVSLLGSPIGTATLGGALEVSLTDGFVPALGNTFDIITFEASAGAFAATSGLDLGGGRSLLPSVQPTLFRLTVV